jgi:hypothetical protein
MRAMLALKPQNDDPLPLADAVGVIKSFPPAKFDQTVEIHMRLGIDPKQADQIIRGSLVLPHGIGKAKVHQACKDGPDKRERAGGRPRCADQRMRSARRAAEHRPCHGDRGQGDCQDFRARAAG